MKPNDKIKLFISLPMSGLPAEVVQKNYEKYRKAAEKVMDRPCEYVNTFDTPNAPESAGKLWYLGNSIQAMGGVDCVCFSPDWYTSAGCVAERLIAHIYKIPIIVLHEDHDDAYIGVFEGVLFSPLNYGIHVPIIRDILKTVKRAEKILKTLVKQSKADGSIKKRQLNFDVAFWELHSISAAALSRFPDSDMGVPENFGPAPINTPSDKYVAHIPVGGGTRSDASIKMWISKTGLRKEQCLPGLAIFRPGTVRLPEKDEDIAIDPCLVIVINSDGEQRVYTVSSGAAYGGVTTGTLEKYIGESAGIELSPHYIRLIISMGYFYTIRYDAGKSALSDIEMNLIG